MNLTDALTKLDEVAPGAPLLALGQTVFWDEPMKVGIAQALKRGGSARRFIAGVHDTDYFAKVPGGRTGTQRFKALPHNDTTTRGLWSAAGEFSALFGSETVVTREQLLAAGLRVERLEQARPGFLDEATEAWGWKGIVSQADVAPVTADVPAAELIQELKATLQWAIDLSLTCLQGEHQHEAKDVAYKLITMLCDAYEADPSAKLADVYERLLPKIAEFTVQGEVELETARTSHLLRFNTETCGTPRFELLEFFLRPETKAHAKAAYDEAVKGSGLYGLSRFGTGAIPFDVYIPGKGRGTLRLGSRGIVINTPVPQFASLKRPVASAQELAEVLEAKFGPNLAIVGKAVALIGMLGREFSFVFHEGASGYVKHSRTFHQRLESSLGKKFDVKPILRIRYDAWSALDVTCAWLKLPELMKRPFGTDELCSPSFGSRWKAVGKEEADLLNRLGKIKRPLELIALLDSLYGGSWGQLAKEYAGLHTELNKLRESVDAVRAQRIALYKRRNQLKDARRAAESALGTHFRATIFEKTPTAADLLKRETLSADLSDVIAQQESVRNELMLAFRAQRELAQDAAIQATHRRRRNIELEAELKRAKIIREAVLASKGLEHANYRPSAWWFPLVSPDGLWYRETLSSADCYLEPLV